MRVVKQVVKKLHTWTNAPPKAWGTFIRSLKTEGKISDRSKRKNNGKKERKLTPGGEKKRLKMGEREGSINHLGKNRNTCFVRR